MCIWKNIIQPLRKSGTATEKITFQSYQRYELGGKTKNSRHSWLN